MHDSYQNPLCTRYAGKEMQRIFSDQQKLSTWRRLRLTLAERFIENNKALRCVMAGLFFLLDEYRA